MHLVGAPYHWGGVGIVTGDSANELLPLVLDNNVHISEYKVATCDIRPGPAPARPGPAGAACEEYRAARGGRSDVKLETHAWPGSYGEQAKPRMGFFTDTSVCIGCKACEVACKEWNQVPMSIQGFTGKSYDNTGRARRRHAGATSRSSSSGCPRTRRTERSLVQAAERGRRRSTAGVQTYQEGDGMRWLMASDVCKHCTDAACLEVCPTGALFRTEFGTVVVQEDVCNGCGYCVSACPFGVHRPARGGRAGVEVHALLRPAQGRQGAGVRAGLPDGLDPVRRADELRERAEHRLAALQDAGQDKAQLYLADDEDGVGGAGAFFLLLDEPEVYGLPPDPVDTTRDLGSIWAGAAGAAGALGARPRPCSAARARARRRRRSPARPVRSYHGQPVIKEPVWSWEIPCYFFTGGLAGASAGLAYLSELRGNEVLGAARLGRGAGRPRASARRCSSPTSAGPERFLNMLRDVQGHLADERRLVDPRAPAAPATALGGRQRLDRAASRARPRSRVRRRRCSACRSPPTPRRWWPTPPCRSGTRRAAMLPFVFGAGAALSAGAAAVIATPPAHAARRGGWRWPERVRARASALMERRLGEHGEPYREGARRSSDASSRACIVGRRHPAAARGGRPGRRRSRRARCSAPERSAPAGACSRRACGRPRIPSTWSARSGAQSSRGERRGAARREANPPADGAPRDQLTRPE